MLQCSNRISNPLRRKWISSLSFVSDSNIAKIFGVEYYPECISKIMNFIDEEYDAGDQASKDNFDSLIRKSILICSNGGNGNSFINVLEAHGWLNDSFCTECGNFSPTVFKTVLKLLYYSQIWKVIRLKERRDSNLLSSRGIYHDDDNLALAFVPTILHGLVTQNIPKLRRCPSGVEAICIPSATTTFSGACVLADISGFTKMSAKFCEQGLSGLDDLHRSTSGFLGQYVQIVYAHGGDVIAFAGDALMCVFTDISIYSPDMQAKHTHLELCCASALCCSLKLVDMRTDILTSHVGITCGDMQFTSLGGFKNEWTFVLTGDVISKLSSCIEEASSCQVGISSDVHTNLSQVVEPSLLNATPTKSGNFIIETVKEGVFTTHIQLRNRFKAMSREASVVKLMRSFVPRPVLHSIMYGTLDTISELRIVTTVFLKLDSYCPVGNADPSTLQPLFLKVQEALSESGGFMRQFLIDDKGCVLIAMWGVPSYTFKNNNARAVYFALSIHKGLEELGHKCSIGITTGNVFCGNVGSLQRRDYVGIGAKVNLAARLMSKSKGSIYIDEDTAVNMKKLLPNMGKSEGMQLKGYSELMYAYVLSGKETFVLSTKGSVSSTYVQAGVTKQVMALLNSVCAVRHQLVDQYNNTPKAFFDFRRNSNNLICPVDPPVCDVESPLSSRVTSSVNQANNSTPNPNIIEPIFFEGGLEDTCYQILYKELPSPDTDDDVKTRKNDVDDMHMCSIPSQDENSVCDYLPVKPKLGAARLQVITNMEKLKIQNKALHKPLTPQQHLRPNSPYVFNKTTDDKVSRCMVIEAQSGGGKSAVALLFSSYSSKCAMPSYVVKLKTEDQDIDHCVFRKLFFKLVNLDIKASVEEQNITLKSVLKLCTWPNRPHIEDRVEALASGLGLREQVVAIDEDEEEQVDKVEEAVFSAEIATVLRDVMYFFLGQKPCSLVIEHGHFVDALSWSDLHYLMERHIAVGILVTARVGSNKEDFSKEEAKFMDAGSRQQHLKDFQRSFRTHSSVATATATGSATPASDHNTSAKSNISSSRNIQGDEGARSNTKRRKDRESSRRRSFEHFFDLEEPEKENKIAYDRAHYTESYNLLISHERTHKFELPKLEVKEIGHLFTVDLHWHEDDIKIELLTKMHQLTHGNAYWCKEVAHFISVRGTESFMKDPIAALSTVVVTKVTEKLTMEQQITVKAASIIGNVFSIETLKLAVSQRLHESLLDSVMYLADHNFLTKLSDDPLVYSFHNVHIRNILKDLSPPSERANLHVSIAQQVEGVNEHNLEPFYELLCYHYSQAMDYQEKVVYYQIKSAQKVLPLGYFDDVYGYLEKASSLTTSLGDLYEIKDMLEVAILSIAESGPRSARAHRRPSLEISPTLTSSVLTMLKKQGSDTSLAPTPRTASQLAELPSKYYQLEALVKDKIVAVSAAAGAAASASGGSNDSNAGAVLQQ